MTEVRPKIGAAWNNWRKVSPIIYDKKMPERLKHCVYETVVPPALLYGAETRALQVEETDRLRTTEANMLRWFYATTRKDHVRNADLLERVNLVPIEEALRTQRLKWYGHMPQRDKGYPTRAAFDLEIVGERPRGRPQKHWMGVIADMKKRGLRPQIAQDCENGGRN